MLHLLNLLGDPERILRVPVGPTHLLKELRMLMGLGSRQQGAERVRREKGSRSRCCSPLDHSLPERKIG